MPVMMTVASYNEWMSYDERTYWGLLYASYDERTYCMPVMMRGYIVRQDE